jgi:sugar lactone lactonase YvrE
MRLAILLTFAMAAFSQLPTAKDLPAADAKGFFAEIHRLEKLLEAPVDHATVVYAMARTYAAGGQYKEAIEWLKKAIALDAGIDPTLDRVFQEIRRTSEFSVLLDLVRDQTPPISHSRVGFSIAEEGLAPEGIAYDPRRKRFYMGSTAKHKILECTAAGECRTFAEQQGLSEVLGIKIDPRDGSLWTASNADTESDVFHFAIPSGKLLRKYDVGKGHVFNDLAIGASGDVFVTDTRGGTVYWISRATNRLELLKEDLKAANANGIVLSDDGKKLFVSSFPDGITVIDVASRSSHPIGHPANLCLGSIDGLSFFQNSLIAIQNGVVTKRVARFVLSPDQNSITSFDILERRNPMFEGITTGAVAEGWYYYMANVDAKSHPTTILKIDLRR